VTEAVASASPSISPTASAPTPSVDTKNNGSRLWTISEETSISMLTNPKAQTVRGIFALVTVAVAGSDVGSFIGKAPLLRQPATAAAQCASYSRKGDVVQGGTS